MAHCGQSRTFFGRVTSRHDGDFIGTPLSTACKSKSMAANNKIAASPAPYTLIAQHPFLRGSVRTVRVGGGTLGIKKLRGVKPGSAIMQRRPFAMVLVGPSALLREGLA